MKQDKNYVLGAKNKTSKQKFLIPIILVLVVGGGFFAYRQLTNKPSNSSETTQTDSTTLNLDPPTEEEKAQADQRKDDIAKEGETPSQAPSPNVTPIISGANPADFSNQQYVIGAFIPGIYEGGGTCSLTATSGAHTIKRDSPAEKDATTTRCENFIINRADFPIAGNWNIVVRYTSASHNGESQPSTMEVK